MIPQSPTVRLKVMPLRFHGLVDIYKQSISPMNTTQRLNTRSTPLRRGTTEVRSMK